MELEKHGIFFASKLNVYGLFNCLFPLVNICKRTQSFIVIQSKGLFIVSVLIIISKIFIGYEMGTRLSHHQRKMQETKTELSKGGSLRCECFNRKLIVRSIMSNFGNVRDQFN